MSVCTDKNDLREYSTLRMLGFILWRGNWFARHGDHGLEWFGVYVSQKPMSS
jgi:hypothetical protein